MHKARGSRKVKWEILPLALSALKYQPEPIKNNEVYGLNLSGSSHTLAKVSAYDPHIGLGQVPELH